MPSEAAMRAARAIAEWDGERFDDYEIEYVAQIIDREMGTALLEDVARRARMWGVRGASLDGVAVASEIEKIIR